MSVLDRLLERIEKWKRLQALYERFLYEDDADAYYDIVKILCELDHAKCAEGAYDSSLLDDPYYNTQCIKHIIKELEIVVKWLQERGLS
jgi:hypothetical protein